MTEEAYDRDWVGTAMRRATRSGLRRNAAIVLGNLGDNNAAPALISALADQDPVVRGHAAWALGALDAGKKELASLYQREEDERVQTEIRAVLE